MHRRKLLFAPLFFLACSRRASDSKFDYGEAKNKYELRGKVLRLKPEDRIATIAHEKIEGWMEPMTMDFPVPRPEDFSKLREGQAIRATVLTNDLFFWLADIHPE